MGRALLLGKRRKSDTHNAAVAMTIIHAAVCTPEWLLTNPNATANGRNAIQVSVPTPEDTPARIDDGISSWKSRVATVLTATMMSASTICAAMTTTEL